MDKLIFGNIYTMDETMPRAEAVGLDKGRIVFVGSREDAVGLTARSTLDLGDKTIFPGFIDTHVHVIPAGTFMTGVDLSQVSDLKDIYTALGERAATVRKGEWIIGAGFQDKKIKEKRFPTRVELDAVTTANPIFICHNDCHPFSLNSMALKQLKPDPSAEGVEVDDNGEFTGIITDPACIDILTDMLGVIGIGNIVAGCKMVDEYAVANGVTTVFGKDALPILLLREICKEMFKAEFVPMWYSNGCKDIKSIGSILKNKRLNGRTCVCAFADGSFDCHSAGLNEPYTDRPGERGILINSDEEMYEFTAEAHKSGLQVSFHAIGDAAIEQVLRVYERVLMDYPKEDHRLRIEHFEMPSQKAIAKAAELEVALAMQPLLIEVCEKMDFSGYSCFVGERARDCSPYRSVLDAGILEGGGTDYPVTPMRVLHGARICMENPNPAERITLMECLKMNTVNAAKLGFLEDRKGMIKKGLDGDLVVLDRDPFSVTCEELSDITVERTFCKGRQVFSVLEGKKPWRKRPLGIMLMGVMGKKITGLFHS